MASRVITPHLLMAEAGRQLMAGELATVQAHWPELRLSAGMVAVHETRKAIRRTFTLFKIFTPFFIAGELEPHRRGLRKIMRRLAPCRDTAVFRQKLKAYNDTAERPLLGLLNAWDARQQIADDNLRLYLAKPRAAATLERYAVLASTLGSGLPPAAEEDAPIEVRHALPAIIFQRFGAVEAYGDLLPGATEEQLHQLRIQFKELRYTLTFFKELLGDEGSQIIDECRKMQDFLGELNDASVAIELMTGMEAHREEAAIYSAFQRARLESLVDETEAHYARFNRPELRAVLAAALAAL